MKYTITSTCDLTWDEGVDFFEYNEECWITGKEETIRFDNLSGRDKNWLLSVHEAIRHCPDCRLSYEFIFKRTSKKRFEFSLIRCYWPDVDVYPEEDQDIEDVYEPERTVSFKWVAEEPCWVLMEAIKRQVGYYTREDAESIPAPEHGHWVSDAPF